MLRKSEPGKKRAALRREPSDGGRLLDEVQALGRVLSLTRSPVAPPDARRRSLSPGKSRFAERHWKPRELRRDPRQPPAPSQKDKKPPSSPATSSSIWSWKPLRALSHIRHRRFDCLFTLHVHSVEGLPPGFHGVSLGVHWKRNAAEAGLRTRPARVALGAATFEETLEHRCPVYGSRGSWSHRAAKYEARQFVLYPAVVGAPDVDLGKHLVDFTRLLPVTLEELEEETSGRWSTTFKLSGKATGAALYVSFGFALLGGKDMADPGGYRKASELLFPEADGMVGGAEGRRVGSIPAPNHELRGRLRLRSQSVKHIKVVHEVLLPTSGSEPVGLVDVGKLPMDKNCYECELDDLVDVSKAAFKVLAQQDKLPVSRSEALSQQMKVDLEFDDPEFTVIEQGVEVVGIGKEGIGTRDDLRERVELRKAGKADKYGPEDDATEDNILIAETTVEELESAFQSLSISESVGLDSLKAEVKTPEHLDYKVIKSDYKMGKTSRSLSLDDVTESVAGEFLSMLGIEHSPLGSSSDSDPDSPRECLWKQFKRESLSNGGSFFGVDAEREEELDWKRYTEDFSLSPVVHAAETEHQNASQTTNSKTRARMLEDAEAEALMHEWGLNEKAFENSPPGSAIGFGSPIELPPDDPLHLPSLGDGLGPYVQTRDGGFLRSMNPSLFMSSKNNGSLIVQASCPVVLPAEVGSSIMEILQHLASLGIEKLSMQASKVMPLEDITGMTMQQVAWEALPALEACERRTFCEHLEAEGETRLGRNAAIERKIGKISSPSSSDYVSMEELVPLAMEKIEALSIEGLRIQSGMSYEVAHLSISFQSVGEVSTLEGNVVKGCMLRAVGLQLLDVKDGIEDVDGLLGLSITLDEWIKLDRGITGEEDQNSNRTSRIFAAHHASFEKLVGGGWVGERKGGKNSGRKWGLLGNNLTIALLVQLRDPLRNYEPVGTPMLSLIQVERVFVPTKSRMHGTVSDQGGSEQEEEPGMKHKSSKEEEKKEGEEEVVPQFRITEAHIAGFKTDPDKKRFWGNAMQEQSGARWLLANGMGGSNKHSFWQTKIIKKPLQGTTERLQPGDTLWSISSS